MRLTQDQLSSYVTRAVEVDREIAELTAELKDLKRVLILEATRHEKDLVRIPDGGKSIAFSGDDGCVARIIFPKRTLKDSVNGEGRTIERIRDLAGQHFSRLFLQAPKYVPVGNFRDEAQSLLGKDAWKLVKACTVNSSARVSFETKSAEDTVQ